MKSNYQQIKFTKSVAHINDAPPDYGIEIAFAGRSNAGKSSAINTLASRKDLARTSKTPGRTQLLNYFEVAPERRLVDLPGYGYAKVPLAIKKQWHVLIEAYLQKRDSLSGIVLVMDIRHPLSEFDWQMLTWCQHARIPTHILLTKTDKLSHGQAKNTLLGVQKECQVFAQEVSLQLFSALKKTGIADIHTILDQWLQLPVNDPSI